MSPQAILDSHVHLIPRSAANSTSHAWMHDGHPLQRQWDVSHYLDATTNESVRPGQPQAFQLQGFVYVETDRALGPKDLDPHERWRGPLDEVAFVRRLVEGTPREGETNPDARSGALLLGSVLWAPVDQGPQVLLQYLKLAEDVAGPLAWRKVKGFRYLVQGIKDQRAFTKLVTGDAFIDALKLLGKMGYAFDVGVDQRQGGVWQLQGLLECIRRVRSGCTQDEHGVFVLNHLCKPDMKALPTTDEQVDQFTQWQACMKQYSSFEKVYMKLSGGFSELPEQDETAPWSQDQITRSMGPWIQCVYETFGPSRLMFGSDWPVCTLGGPGVVLSWTSWRCAIAESMEQSRFDQASKNAIWCDTAVRAYNLDSSDWRLH